jgi:hypothetical protein
MATVASGTQFIGLAANYPTKQLRSALINEQSAAYTIEDINASSSGQAIYTNGFTITGAINTNITLPNNATVNYTGPLSMGAGYVLTVPTSTTLNIL